MLFLLPVMLLHILLAWAVYRDGCRRQRQDGPGLFLVGVGLWTLAVLVQGLFTLALYWAVHYSALARIPGPGATHPKA